MRFLKKGLFADTIYTDYRAEEWEIAELTRNEFFNLNDLKFKVKEIQDKNNSLVNDYNNILIRYKEVLENLRLEKEKVKEMDNTLNSVAIKYKDMEKSNIELLRVFRERANADRGITPKKRHSGYTLKTMENVKYLHTFEITQGMRKRTARKEIPFYKYKLETPYTTQFDFAEVRKIIILDLKEKFGLDLIRSSSINKSIESKIPFFFNIKLNYYDNQSYYIIEFLSNAYINFDKKD